jgi:hypothetical protein
VKSQNSDTWFIYRAASKRWFSVPPVLDPYVSPAAFGTWREALDHMLANDRRRAR